MDKIFPSIEDALAGIEDGMAVMIGGFGGSGAPIELIHALIERYKTTGSPGSLTVINNNAGNGAVGIAAMIYAGHGRQDGLLVPALVRSARLHRHAISPARSSWNWCRRARSPSASAPAARAFRPSTRRRATARELAEGKPVAEFDGRSYVQERWLKADVALIKAELADRKGNLTYHKAARNFAPLMAMAAATTIVQARQIVEPGEIDPEHVVTPGIFVDRIVEVADPKQEEASVARGAL